MPAATPFKPTPPKIEVQAEKLVSDPVPVDEAALDIQQLAPPARVPSKVNPDDPTSLLDVERFVSKFYDDYDSIVSDISHERKDIQLVSSILLERVQERTATSSETESLVKLLQVGADIHGHRVKLLDTMSKIMASTRQSVTTLIQNNMGSSTGTNDDELLKLLGQE